MRHTECSESRGERGRSEGTGVVVTVIAVVCLALLPFIPLMLAGLESATLGTNWVESSCQKIGIHDALSALYKATVFRWFK